MLTDLIACTSSTDTCTERVAENEEVRGRGGGRGRGTRVSSHSNSRSVPLSEEIGEELLLNAIAVCTNITFYACKVRTLTYLHTQFILISDIFCCC